MPENKWNMPGSLALFNLVIYYVYLVKLIGEIFLSTPKD